MRKLRHRSTVFALTALALALAPVAARGASFSAYVSGGAIVSGPALASDGQALWVERRGGSQTLVAASATAPPHDVVTLPPATTSGRSEADVTLTASGHRAVIERVVTTCAGCAHEPRLLGRTLLAVDLTTGVAQPIDPCAPAHDAACRRCLRVSLISVRPLLRDDVLALTGCGIPSAVVIDLGDGTRRALDDEVLDVAGEHAIINGVDGPTEVAWRTGAIERRLPSDAPTSASRDDQTVAVDADGSIAYVGTPADARFLPWAATSARRVSTPSQFGGRSAYSRQVALANGRVAQRVVDSTDAPSLTLAVAGTHALRWTQPAPDWTGANTTWAFDGARLAWADEACARAAVRVWDLGEAAPTLRSGACVGPRLARRWVTYREGELRLPFRCPATADDGCAATVDVRLHRAQTFGYAVARVAAGTRKTIAVGLRRPRKLRGAHRLGATVEITPVARDEALGGGGRRARRDVTARVLP